jgi:putative membrane-bound dehydrogenase-like protein
VAAAPDILFFKDTDGDGHADVRRVVLTGFDTTDDLYRVNSLQWGNDGWIYARGVGDTPIRWGDAPDGPALSTRGMNFRFRPKPKQFEALSGLSSCFGLTLDDWGRAFFPDSSRHVYQVVLPDRYLARNPFLAAPQTVREISDHGSVAEIFRLSPPAPWRQERSAIWKEMEGEIAERWAGIHKELRQDYMTAVCGPKVYREAAFPEEYRGSYFVCDAVGNLVHRDVLRGDGPVFTAAQGHARREFLASTDPWSCPVYLEAGPDGALYVCDIYRQIIEHPGFNEGLGGVPNVPLHLLQKYGMRAGSTMGRIYRVAPEGGGLATKPRLGRAGPRELVAALGHPAAWWRTTAQRLILEHPEAADAGAIAALARTATHPAARLQALWTLEALGKLDGRLILEALSAEAPGLRENALRLAEPRLASDPALVAAVLGRVEDPNPSVRFQLAFTLGEHAGPGRVEALAALARRDANDADIRVAVLSSIGDDGLALYRLVASDRAAGPGTARFLSELALVIGARLDRAEIAELLGLIDGRRRDSPEACAAALQGLVRGIKTRGRKGLDVPGARAALWGLLASDAEPIRKAAGELAPLLSTRTEVEHRAAFERALATAADGARSVEERAEAVRELGSGPLEAAASHLKGLLHPSQPEPLQLAALRALDEQAGPDVVKPIVEAWPGLTPALRPKAIDVALGRKDRIPPLLEALRRRDIPPEAIDGPHRARLLSDKAGAEAARAIFGAAARPSDPRRFERFKAALDLKGDPRRGAATFRARCLTCHKVGKEGTEIGPGLAGVKNHPREQVLRDILYPSLTFQPSHLQYSIATKDGQIYTGLIVSSGASSLTLRRPGAEDVTLLRKDFEELTNTKSSIMSEDLLEGLNLQEVADLLEYIGQIR